MSYIWLIVCFLFGALTGVIFGIYVGSKWTNPADEINVRKAKNKKGNFDLTNMFNKKQHHGKK